jgi:hypothetical protein
MLKTLVNKVVCNDKMHLHDEFVLIISQTACVLLVYMLTWVETQVNSYEVEFFVKTLIAKPPYCKFGIFAGNWWDVRTPCSSFPKKYLFLELPLARFKFGLNFLTLHIQTGAENLNFVLASHYDPCRVPQSIFPWFCEHYLAYLQFKLKLNWLDLKI